MKAGVAARVSASDELPHPAPNANVQSGLVQPSSAPSRVSRRVVYAHAGHACNAHAEQLCLMDDCGYICEMKGAVGCRCRRCRCRGGQGMRLECCCGRALLCFGVYVLIVAFLACIVYSRMLCIYRTIYRDIWSGSRSKNRQISRYRNPIVLRE